MKRLISVTAATVMLLAVLQTPAWADTKRIGKATARGDYATTIADGDVNNPTAIWVKIKARPNQKADGNWSMVCDKGVGAGSKSGSYSGTTPYVRRLKMPYSRPDSCIVSALGSLSNSGKIIVILLARV